MNEEKHARNMCSWIKPLPGVCAKVRNKKTAGSTAPQCCSGQSAYQIPTCILLSNAALSTPFLPPTLPCSAAVTMLFKPPTLFTHRPDVLQGH